MCPVVEWERHQICPECLEWVPERKLAPKDHDCPGEPAKWREPIE